MAKKAPEDPSLGWTDERIVREFIDFAERSADDSGPTSEMAEQARGALQRLVGGTGSTEAEAELVAAAASLDKVVKSIGTSVNPKMTADEMLAAVRNLIGASEHFNIKVTEAGSLARSKLQYQIQTSKTQALEAIDRIRAHMFRFMQ